MANSSPKMFKYKKANVILTIGIDQYGRIFSSLEKNGQMVARDIYVKFPSEVKLAQEGWTRYYE